MHLRQMFEQLKKSPVTSEVATTALHAFEVSGTAFLKDVKDHLPEDNSVHGLVVQALMAAVTSAITKRGA